MDKDLNGVTGLGKEEHSHSPPEEREYDPGRDWINQRQLADLVGIAPETASRWAREGKLEIFEHGMVGGGKRKYSRQLVAEYQRLRLQQARRRMRERIEAGDASK